MATNATNADDGSDAELVPDNDGPADASVVLDVAEDVVDDVDDGHDPVIDTRRERIIIRVGNRHRHRIEAIVNATGDVTVSLNEYRNPNYQTYADTRSDLETAMERFLTAAMAINESVELREY
jgi:hypothetical protein